MSTSLIAKNVWFTTISALVGLGVGVMIGSGFLGHGGPSAETPSHRQSKALVPVAYVSKNGDFRKAVSFYRAKQPRSPEDRLYFLRTVEAWLSQDPSDCVNSLREMGAVGMLDDGVLVAAFSQGVDRNYTVLAKQASEIQDPDLRGAVVRALFDRISASNPEGALDLLPILPTHLRYDLQATLGRIVGATEDPVLFAKMMKNPNVVKDLVIAGLQTWASSNTSDALSFFQNTSEGDLQRMGTSKTYILEKLRTFADPEALLTYAEKQPPSLAISRAMTEATGTLLARDPSRWDELAGRQKSEAMISMIAADAAAKAVVKSPETAAVFLSRIGGVDARMQATKQVTREFMIKGGGTTEKIIAWARSIEDPVIAERIIEELRFQNRKLPPDFKLR